MDELSEFPFLTRAEFLRCIDHFEEQFGSLIEIRRDIHKHQQFVRIYQPLFSPDTSNSDVQIDEIENVEDFDPVEALADDVPAATRTVCGQVEYHVVYSASWRVPVLYMRVVLSEPSRVVLDAEQVTNLLVADQQVRGAIKAVEFGGALGIQDHPVLNEPFVYLHPCHTATLLRAVGVTIDAKNYMSAWLSLTGSAVGLTLPLFMKQL
ncbi:E2-like conjugating enzyme atg10 [Coemansia brasiliensis]|uniref:Ubiquitin-like-conjugating enzyme ATG10 n=1 Tax=Coemansia brasiliensis TaxID=2650707 RepID=A0A9W8I954_9FUNG|nr:E2-like conjugating enzyme atg10 [Coemansia brasiliensis]